jgi:hypothetical protein
MKYKDWSNFKLHCSDIAEAVAPPRNVRPLTNKEEPKYESYLAKQAMNEPLTPNEESHLLKLQSKIKRFNDPELSITAIKRLTRRYAYERYNKKTAATYNYARGSQLKGTLLEMEAIEILGRHDKCNYIKCDVSAENDYLLGRCDVLYEADNKIVEVKTSWNINTMMQQEAVGLPDKIWWQAQGYLDVYEKELCEVSFVLLNTPPHLVSQERTKLDMKYVYGEIMRDKYDEELEKFELFYDYSKIPLKRRVLTYTVNRDKELMQYVYSRIEKCRIWLNEFERQHMNRKNILTLSQDYDRKKKDNTEFDTAEPLQSD